MNLFVRICRFLSDILTRSSPAPVYDLSCIEKHQLLELFESDTKEDLFGGLPVGKLSLHFPSLTGTISATLLFYFCSTLVLVREGKCNESFPTGRPPALSQKLKNGAKLEDVSLSVPGKEKMIETDETLTITLDFETKDYKSGSYGADWDRELNAVFISAHIEPRHSPEYPSPRIFKSIHSRVNLGNVVLYKQATYGIKLKDGVLMVTFHKNPQNAPYISKPLFDRYYITQ
ncbi:hypothetical protein Tco_0865397 [Tanacetum coccineum]